MLLANYPYKHERVFIANAKEVLGKFVIEEKINKDI